MTISSQVRVAGPYVGAGVAATFAFTFKVFSAADLLVVVLDEATNLETTLVLTTDYTVSLNGNQNASPGGSITLVAGNLATGYKLTVTSELDYLQATDLANQGGFYPKVITDALDRLTIFVQQLYGLISRGMRFPISDGVISGELPVKAVRAGKFLTFDEDGNPTVDGAINTYYYGALSVDPTTRPNGSAVNQGDYYFNSVDKQMRVYNGTQWSNTNSGAVSVNTFSGDGAAVEFTLSTDPGTERNTQVYISGAYVQKDQYVVSGTTLTFGAAPALGVDNIEVVVLSVAEISVFTPSQIYTLGEVADTSSVFGRTIVASADAAAARALLGVAPPPAVALSKSFTSSDQTVSAAGGLTLAHGLGAVPMLVQFFLVCQTADQGYSAGDIIGVSPNPGHAGGGGGGGFSAWVDTTNVNVRFASVGGVMYIFDKTTGNFVAMNPVRWKLRARAFA